MPLLSKLAIEGFRSFRKIELDCADLNVIVGANGAGKSTLIDVFELTHRALRSSDPRFFLKGTDERHHHHGVKRTPRFWFRYWFSDFRYELRFESELGRSVLDNQMVSVPGCSFGWQRPGKPDLSPLEGVVRNQVETALNALLELSPPYHFHDTSESSAMRRPANVHDNRVLRADGSNLPALLLSLSQHAPEAYSLIIATVRQVAPWFETFSLKPDSEDVETIRLEWKHRDSDAYFDAFSLSDGSLRFICLCVLLLQQTPPPLIFLDEPELGLHPAALTLLAEMVGSVRSQVFVATQSAALVSYFRPEDIVVADYDQGASVLRRVNPGELDSWIERYSLSELWEKNLLGGRP